MKHFLRILTLAVLTAGALAGCSDDGPKADAQHGVGTVTGTVIDDFGDALGGVTVSCADGASTTSTDLDGTYALEGVKIGTGIVTFSKSGYQTASVTVTAAKFNAEGVATVDASLEYAAAKIEGRVLDAKNGNAPLEGATVSISESQSVTTGADGRYALENLPLDTYDVTFAKEGYATIVRKIGLDAFVDGVATLDMTMGGREILRDKTADDLALADKWYFNEYRGGRNAESYPHWDWSTDYMAALDFYGNWEEQNEGTTLRIRNDEGDRSNPADTDVFDSYVYGSKLITDDNRIMTLQVRTHNGSDDEPVCFGVQVVDLSQAEPEAVKIGQMQTLNSEAYKSFAFDLSAYKGKEVVIAVGIYRARTGDYWKQLVLRRIAFASEPVDGWGWLPGTEVTGLEGWKMTQEMVRSTMPHTKQHFTGISPVSGNRDNYVDAYRAWRDVDHIAANWSFMPLHKDPEVFPSEGYLIKTRGGGTAVNLNEPESYFYAKYAIGAGCNRLVLTTRNFSSTNATYFKLAAIGEDGTVTSLAPDTNTASSAEAAGNGCWKFIHEDGGAGSPDKYATFEYDLSQFDGKSVVLALGIFKGEENGDENKLVIYSLDLQ